MKTGKTILSVPYIDQTKNYPTGCESVTSVMALMHAGYDIDVDTFIEKYLPKSAFEERDGQLWGPDPNVAFVGSPYDTESFGCFAPVIKEALTRFLNDKEGGVNAKHVARDVSGKSVDALCEEFIDKGIPVIFWANIDMKEPYDDITWRVFETGEEYQWIGNEHCMLLIGYDETSFYFNDPWNNHGVIDYPREDVIKFHAVRNNMAVVLEKVPESGNS